MVHPKDGKGMGKGSYGMPLQCTVLYGTGHMLGMMGLCRMERVQQETDECYMALYNLVYHGSNRIVRV